MAPEGRPGSRLEQQCGRWAFDHVALLVWRPPFLTLTLFIAMFERDHGPAGVPIRLRPGIEHVTLPYPDIAT